MWNSECPVSTKTLIWSLHWFPSCRAQRKRIRSRGRWSCRRQSGAESCCLHHENTSIPDTVQVQAQHRESHHSHSQRALFSIVALHLGPSQALGARDDTGMGSVAALECSTFNPTAQSTFPLNSISQQCCPVWKVSVERTKVAWSWWLLKLQSAISMPDPGPVCRHFHTGVNAVL